MGGMGFVGWFNSDLRNFMAMTITHLRFAQEVSEFLKIQNFSAYYSGVAYPDSRNVTGIARLQTHQEENINPFKSGLTDFEKGWQVHSFYDQFAKDGYISLTPWPKENLDITSSRVWCFATAEKIVEDLMNLEVIGHEISSLIKKIVCPALSPLGEDQILLKKYYAFITEMYSRKPKISDYRKMLSLCGTKPEAVDEVINYTEQISNDEVLKQKIKNIYNEVYRKFVGLVV